MEKDDACWLRSTNFKFGRCWGILVIVKALKLMVIPQKPLGLGLVFVRSLIIALVVAHADDHRIGTNIDDIKR